MTRPNVLLICVDHWPGPLLGAAGHEHILTPTLNQLAANGVRFSQAYTSTPTCIPARRALMTGTTAKTHGDRVFQERLEMDPRLTTMPQAFRDAGYQATAVGKLHVYPQRSRIGFDEVILNEEGRHHLQPGFIDDWERHLADQGFAGQESTHGMGNNEYFVRPWHLPEHCHSTHWTVREMSRTIQRRDPTKPGFWYCSFVAPHPPIVPPAEYLEMYRDVGVDEPFVGDWARDPDAFPLALKKHMNKFSAISPAEAAVARMGFYAQCTYIDHQLRLVIGTLREQGLADDTIVMMTSDHGDMLGTHNLFCKPPMHEWSAKVPMILAGAAGDERVGHHRVDDRLAELRDIMPTLLDLCDIPIPETVEGNSLVSETRRDHLYCEHGEGDHAMRMIRTDQYKLIWYPVGNHFQLFDLAEDPCEMHDLAADAACADVRARLEALLLDELYGSDMPWVQDGRLVGEPDKDFTPLPNRGLAGQRGWR